MKLLDTEADHLFAVLEHKKAGNAAHHYMRRIHNYALNLGWLLTPVMAEAAWPRLAPVLGKEKRSPEKRRAQSVAHPPSCQAAAG